MTAQILDGKELSKKIKENLKLEVDKLKENGITPKLAVIMVGDNSASAVYVKNKSNACKKVGIEFEEFLLPTETTEDELIKLIDKTLDKEIVHDYDSYELEKLSDLIFVFFNSDMLF